MTPFLQSMLGNPDYDPGRSTDLLDTLVSLAIEPPDGDDRALLASHLRTEAASRALSALARHLERALPTLPPKRSTPWKDEAWLRDIERVALAQQGAAHLPVETAAKRQIVDRLEATLARIKPGIESTPRLRLLAGIEPILNTPERAPFPWNVVGGTGASSLPSPGPDSIEAWARGTLQPSVARALREEVSRTGPWQTAYRRYLAERAREVEIVVYDTPWRPGVARTLEEDVPPALRVPLPHLRNGQRVLVVPYADRSRWTVPMADPPVRTVGRDVDSFTWGDHVTGQVTTAIRWTEIRPWELPDQALSAADGLIRDARAPGGRETALALARSLAEGVLHDVLERAARAFEDQEEEDDELTQGVRTALRVRVALEHAGAQLDDHELVLALMDADDRLEPLAPAVLLLDFDEVDAILDGCPPDDETWWGVHARLASGPRQAIEEALREVLRSQREPAD